MASKEYYEGKDFESNNDLQLLLKRIFPINDFDNLGGSGTKVDLVGLGKKCIYFSIKNGSGRNTQVHATTLKAFCNTLNANESVYQKLERWFGTCDLEKFKIWSKGLTLNENLEIRRQRLGAHNIKDWEEVLDWLNNNNKSGVLPKLLLQSLNNDYATDFLIWRNKKTNRIIIVDIHKYVKWITDHCTWIMSKSKRGHNFNIWCVGPNDEKIFSLQMKGAGEGDLYHTPQFHTYKNWPKEFVVFES